MFKVGDKVRVVSPDPDCTEDDWDFEGVVIIVDDNPLFPYVVYGPDGEEYPCIESELTLIGE